QHLHPRPSRSHRLHHPYRWYDHSHHDRPYLCAHCRCCQGCRPLWRWSGRYRRSGRSRFV
ncbi:hypothetical protein E4U43_006181, partial [Claviceps pusilla]